MELTKKIESEIHELLLVSKLVIIPSHTQTSAHTYKSFGLLQLGVCDWQVLAVKEGRHSKGTMTIVYCTTFSYKQACHSLICVSVMSTLQFSFVADHSEIHWREAQCGWYMWHTAAPVDWHYGASPRGMDASSSKSAVNITWLSLFSTLLELPWPLRRWHCTKRITEVDEGVYLYKRE